MPNQKFIERKGLNYSFVRRMNLFGNLGGFDHIRLALENAANADKTLGLNSCYHLITWINQLKELFPRNWIKEEMPRILNAFRKVFNSWQPE